LLSQTSSDIRFGHMNPALLCTDIPDRWLRNEYLAWLIISQLEQVVAQWNAILFQLFYGWSIYRPVFISIYQTQMKLEPPSGVCQRGISISVYILGKAWNHSAASNYLYLFVCAMVYSLFIVFFQTFQMKCKTGIWERIHCCHFIIYRLLVLSPF
jgi:hypothetical protein